MQSIPAPHRSEPLAAAHALGPLGAKWGAPAAIVLLTLVLYGRVYHAQFVAIDDQTHVTANPLLRPLSWSGLGALWQAPYAGIYSPVSYTFFAVETWLAEGEDAAGQPTLNPVVFHVGGVLLHALAAVLAFALLQRLVQNRWAAFFGAMVFAWHPLQVESVAWISGTTGVLAGVFSLAAMLEYLRFRETPVDVESIDDSHTQLDPPSVRHRWIHYLAACVAYGLALLSKPTAVAIPPALILVDVLWYRRSAWRSLAWLGWWIVPALVLTAVTHEEQARHVAQFVYVPPWYLRPFVAGDALAYYLSKVVLPLGLSVANGRPVDQVFDTWWAYAAWLVPLVLAALAAWSAARRAWLTAWGLFVVCLAPVLGFVPFVYQEISTVANRYVYLAMIGPALAVAWLMTRPRLSTMRVEAAIVLAALGATTFWQTGYWLDTRAVAERALEINRENVIALSTLAQLEFDAGDIDNAETLLEQAAEIDPDGAKVWMNLAEFYFVVGRDDDARQAIQRAMAQSDYNPAPYLLLARLWLRQGKHEEVIDEMSRLLGLMPDLVEARRLLARSLAAGGRFTEAVDQGSAILEQQPRDLEAHLLVGAALVQLGRHAEARRHFESALQLAPADATALEAIRRIDAAGSSRDPR